MYITLDRILKTALVAAGMALGAASGCTKDINVPHPHRASGKAAPEKTASSSQAEEYADRDAQREETEAEEPSEPLALETAIDNLIEDVGNFGKKKEGEQPSAKDVVEYIKKKAPEYASKSSAPEAAKVVTQQIIEDAESISQPEQAAEAVARHIRDNADKYKSSASGLSDIPTSTGRPPVDYDGLGLGEWKKAQEEREKKKDESVGWEGEHEDPIDSFWGHNLGKDRLRLTLRERIAATLDKFKIAESLRFEVEPFESLAGDDGLRFDISIGMLNAAYDDGLSVYNPRVGLGITKFIDLDDVQFMLGLGANGDSWNSNGKKAPDSINIGSAFAKGGIRFPGIGLELNLRYEGIFQGEYEIFGRKGVVTGNNAFASLKWNVPETKLFIGAEYDFTQNEFHRNVRELATHRGTLFGGFGDLGFDYLDMIALGITDVEKYDTVGDNYNKPYLELRLRMNLGEENKGWLGLNLMGGESLPQSNERIRLGISIEGGYSF